MFCYSLYPVEPCFPTSKFLAYRTAVTDPCRLGNKVGFKIIARLEESNATNAAASQNVNCDCERRTGRNYTRYIFVSILLLPHWAYDNRPSCLTVKGRSRISGLSSQREPFGPKTGLHKAQAGRTRCAVPARNFQPRTKQFEKKLTTTVPSL